MAHYYLRSRKSIPSRRELSVGFLRWAFENPDKVIAIGFGIVLFGIIIRFLKQ